MLGMKNHFDISGSIEIREVDIARVACSLYAKTTISSQLTIIMAKKYLKIVFANRAPRFWDVLAQPEI